jgi:hypothetical protein
MGIGELVMVDVPECPVFPRFGEIFRFFGERKDRAIRVWEGWSWELRGKDFRLPIGRSAGKNSTRLYTGPKGVRFVPIFGKSADYSLKLLKFERICKGVWGESGYGREIHITARFAGERGDR